MLRPFFFNGSKLPGRIAVNRVRVKHTGVQVIQRGKQKQVVSITRQRLIMEGKKNVRLGDARRETRARLVCNVTVFLAAVPNRSFE